MNSTGKWILVSLLVALSGAATGVQLRRALTPEASPAALPPPVALILPAASPEASSLRERLATLTRENQDLRHATAANERHADDATLDVLQAANLTAIPKEDLPKLANRILNETGFTHDSLTILGINEAERAAGTAAYQRLMAALPGLEAKHVTRREKSGSTIFVEVEPFPAECAALIARFHAELQQAWNPAAFATWREVRPGRPFGRIPGNSRHTFQLEPDPANPSNAILRTTHKYADSEGSGTATGPRDRILERYRHLFPND